MRYIFSLCLLFIGSALNAQDLAVSQDRLDNGLEIVVIEDHRAPIVTHMLWYKVGSADEPLGKSGIAHYLEHLMFKGTDTLGVGEFSKIVRENGGSDNAFTSFDYTGYFQRIAADRLDLVMGMEADRMVNLKIPQGEYAPELGVVLEERNQRTDSNPNALLSEQRRAAQFSHHPYGRPIIGFRNEVEQLTPQDVMDFYKAHYAPNNAILVVAGDVTPESVRVLANKHFGDIPANPAITERIRPSEPPRNASIRLVMEDPRIGQPYIIRSYPAPVRETGDQKEAAIATMLAEVLGGSGVTSFLGRRLTVDEKLAIGVSAWHDDQAYDPQGFNLYLAPQSGISLEEADKALDEALQAFIETGVDEAQLSRIRTQIRASRIYALDDQNGLARIFGSALTQGLEVDDVLAWPDLLAAVTGDEIIEMAKSIFDPTQVVTSYAKGVSK